MQPLKRQSDWLQGRRTHYKQVLLYCIIKYLLSQQVLF
nr:MAG TPA: hypothetical protein [Caudoviricetes sp.]